jgi:hypothetical protein
MSRIRVINEISVPRDSRVASQNYRRSNSIAHARRLSFSNKIHSIPRLGAHKIQKLSARYGRVIYAAEIEANLRVVFYIERNTVVTVDIGSHDLYC